MTAHDAIQPPETRAEHLHEQLPVLLHPGQTFAGITRQIVRIPLSRPTLGWFVVLGPWLLLVAVLAAAVSVLLARGVGIWGIDYPVMWGFAIADYVWWIGIAQAGTLTSCILILFRKQWRNSINRYAEAMTLLAVVCAGIFPLLHLGRPWFFYWLAPYPNTMGLWPQWRSPLIFDFFSLLSYFTLSFLFWYMGLLPDLAAMRDQATKRSKQVFYGMLAMGWRGEARHWARLRRAYVIVAALGTPLVVSVHSIVSLDFAVSIVPGWHETIFPPYFVSGAIFSGMALLMALTVPIRALYRLENVITLKHLDNIARVMLLTALILDYCYAMEWFFAWYGGGNDLHVGAFYGKELVFGAYAPWFWTCMVFLVLLPQLLWLRKVRVNPPLLFLLSITSQIGMWMERVMIVVPPLYESRLPSAWGHYAGTVWDWATLAGSIGLFFAGMMIFLRTMPAVSMSETRELIEKTGKQRAGALAP